MATIIVDTTLDENDGSISDGDTSLRDALSAANSGDTITFAAGAGAAFETGGTIRLAQGLGELALSTDVTIDGDIDDDGAPDVTVTGDTLGNDSLTTDPLGNTITDDADFAARSDNVRVFNVTGGSSAIDGLVVTGGAGYNGSGVQVAAGATLAVTHSSVSGNFAGGSGAIYNAGTLTLTGTVVSGNTAGGYGGGVFNSGTLTMTGTTVSGNEVNPYSGSGGGIFNSGVATLTNAAVSGNFGGINNSGTATLIETTVSGNQGDIEGGIRNSGALTLTGSTVSDNTAADAGGGIDNSGAATLIDTTVSGNRAGRWDGGGLNNRGTLTLTNTTVAGNTAGFGQDGGGIFNSGIALLTNTTVSGNTAPIDDAGDSSGGGIYNAAAGALTLTNTIVLGNSAETSSELEGSITQNGPNLIGGTAGDVFAAIDPVTGGGLVADNGGAARTIALRNDAANPALDAGRDDRLDESVVGIDLNGDGDTTDIIGTDARGGGFARLLDLAGVANNGANTVDLGAFELANTTPALITGTENADTILPGTVSAGVTGGQPLDGDDTIDALGGNDTVDGGGGADSLDGGAGNDSLLGGDGNDTLRGGFGFDTLDGGAGTDTADLSHTGAGATIDLNAGEVAIGGGIETLTGIENVIGTNGDNFINGTGGANRLEGGGGNDTLRGGFGFDTLDGGDGTDTADLSHSDSGAAIDLEAGEANFGGGIETLTGIENVIGTNGANFINGTGGANRLDGAGGDDTLKGGFGFDTLDGGDGDDTADLSHSGSAATIDLDAGEANFGGGVETLTGIENVIGTNGNHLIIGTGGVNRLEGGGGDDTLKGGFGLDTLDGGDGTDTADLSHTSDIVDIDLDAGQAVFGVGVEFLIGIENVIGTGGANFINGTGGANVLEGGGGNDTLQGNGGPDRFLFGGTAFDRDTIVDFTPGTDKIVFDGAGGANDADDLTYTAGNFGGGGNQDIRIAFNGLGTSLAGERIDVLDVGTDIDALKADILFV